jgi:hypothetical protein
MSEKFIGPHQGQPVMMAGLPLAEAQAMGADVTTSCKTHYKGSVRIGKLSYFGFFGYDFGTEKEMFLLQ